MNLRTPNSMTEDQFWGIIENSLKTDHKFYPSIDNQQELLNSELQKLTIKEIIAFECIFSNLKNIAYKQDLWASAFIIMYGCSDDGFMDFRNWLITRGKNVFYKALENSDSLNTEFNKVQDGDLPSWENASYLPVKIIEDVFGKDFYEEAHKYDFDYNKEPDIDFKWEEDNEESIQAICPNTFGAWWGNDKF